LYNAQKQKKSTSSGQKSRSLHLIVSPLDFYTKTKQKKMRRMKTSKKLIVNEYEVEEEGPTKELRVFSVVFHHSKCERALKNLYNETSGARRSTSKSKEKKTQNLAHISSVEARRN
jgi:hypothetical protein